MIRPDVKCPVCHKLGPWLGGDFSPFCSRRCKLIDLGKWLNEEHAFSEPLRPEHLEKSNGQEDEEPSGSG